MELIKWLQGKKTYLIGGLSLVLGGLQAFGVFEVPNELWPVIGALGLASLRAGVNKVADAVKDSN